MIQQEQTIVQFKPVRFCRLEVLSSINSASFSPSNILKRQGSYEKETWLLRASLQNPATSPRGGSHRLMYCNNPAEEISAHDAAAAVSLTTQVDGNCAAEE